MNARNSWSNVLTIVGGMGMVVGAIDPVEGSLLILPGSGLLALGTYLGKGERRVLVYKVWAFVLIAIGVGALWGLSTVGGMGGSSGRSMWWGVLILPYWVGWLMAICGPGNPRWFSLLGIVVGLWYLALSGIILTRQGQGDWAILVVIAATGVVALAGCLYRLVKQMKAKGMATRTACGS
ncbi:MAG: hypothetical protein GXY83_34235 [Rhodopirellula sp.]|nr:hypothetical protein [Rhodopirellula sp.]